MKLKILLFLVLFISSIEFSSASVWGSDGAAKTLGEGTINITEFESKLETWLVANPAYGNVTDFVEQTSSGVWIFRQRLEVGEGSTLVFDGFDDINELRLSTAIGSKGGHVEFGGRYEIGTSYGEIHFKNLTVIGWNETSTSQIIKDNYDLMTKIETWNTVIENTTFVSTRGFYASTIINNDTKKINNLVFEDSEYAFMVNAISNTAISNLSFSNISYKGLSLTNLNSCNVNNIDFQNDASFHASHDTSANGIDLSGGQNNVLSDVNVNGSRWAGISIASNEFNSTISNVIVRYTGHNGIDIHGAHNITLTNITSTHSYSNDIILSGGWGVSVQNISMYDIITGNPAGSNIVIDYDVDNIIIQNFTSLGSADSGIKIFNASNIYVINMTIDEPTISTGFYLTSVGGYGTTNIFLIDSNLKNCSYKDVWFENSNINNIIINSLYSTVSIGSNYYSKCYYPHIQTFDADGTTGIQSYIVLNTTNTSSFNGYGNEKSGFASDTNGITFSPNTNRINSPVISDYQTGIPTEYFTWNITAYGNDSKTTGIYEYPDELSGTQTIYTNGTVLHPYGFKKGIAIGINPNATWYRSNPDISNVSSINITLNMDSERNLTSWIIQPLNNSITIETVSNSSITINSDNSSNQVWINQSGLNSNYPYDLKRDGIMWNSTISDSNGNISVLYDGGWSKYMFTYEDAWEPTQNHIYLGRLFDTTPCGNITQKGIPLEIDDDITEWFNMVIL